MRNIVTYIIFIFMTQFGYGQEQINGSFEFQSDPSKDYSIVVPSTYDEDELSEVFLALHPFNTSRWNGESWCEELIDFAEANNVVLVCPDGGADGKIDDPIDTAFTSVLLDSAFIWYNLNPQKLYAIGFSWGGKTTYTYGLNHIDKFAGLLPIGAAISANDVNSISQNADGVPIFVVHGSQDSPNSRFYPLVGAMEDNGACVETNLLQGVGHSIDFDNQVEILTEAYLYLQENECTITSVETQEIESRELLLSNVVEKGQQLILTSDKITQWTIYRKTGEKVMEGSKSHITVDLEHGTYIFSTGQQSQIFFVF